MELIRYVFVSNVVFFVVVTSFWIFRVDFCEFLCGIYVYIYLNIIIIITVVINKKSDPCILNNFRNLMYKYCGA